MQPFANETFSQILHRLDGAGDGWAQVRAVSFSLELITYYSIGNDGVLTAEIQARSLMDRNMTAFFPVSLGPMQLGNLKGGKIDSASTGLFHLSGLRAGSVQRGPPFFCNQSKCPGWNEIEARGNAYPDSGRYSPTSVIGDTKVATVGAMATSQEFIPIHNRSHIEMFDWVSAPGTGLPAFAHYIDAHLAANETRNYTIRYTFGPPASTLDSDEPRQRVIEALKPYQSYFEANVGNTPTYCPLTTYGWNWAQRSSHWNSSAKAWKPGSTLYNDVFRGDSERERLPPLGATGLVIWQGQIYSTHLTQDGKPFEFNPNSDVLDPNVDAACDESIW